MRTPALPGFLRTLPVVVAPVLFPVLTMAALGLSTLTASSLYAADTLPVNTLDAKAASGRVSSAQTASDGSIATGLSLSGGENVISQKTIDGTDTDAMTLSSARRASVVAGFGLNRRLDLSLGLHGTYEQSDTATAEKSAFSGASMMLKGKIFDGENLSLALAPFVESGAGSEATATLTRSAKPKAGWMLLASYGSAGVGEVSINGGYRYRNAESYGDLNFRNEAFWGASAKGWLSKSFSVFVAGSGRRLMVANETERDPATNKLNYLAATTVDASAGAGISTGAAEFSAYIGQTVKGLFGAGRKFAGASVAWNIDSGAQRRAKPSFADDVRSPASGSKSGRAKKSADEDFAARDVTSAPSTDYPEMNATDIDPLTDLPGDGKDDFSAIEARMKEDSKNTTPSQIELVERELAQIREVEAKAEEQRMKAEAAALKKQRAANVDAAKRRAGSDSKLKKDAEAEAAKMDGITDDELNWMGLE